MKLQRLFKKPFWVGLFVMGGVMIGGVACAQQPTVSQVQLLLKGYEWKLNASAFRSMGEGTDEALMAIAQDKSLPNYYHFRALMALRLFDNDRVADFLENYISEDKGAGHTRRAFESFARGFSQTHPDRVQRAASELLENKNPHVRISAARTLRTFDTSNSRSMLREHIANEEDWVREEIEKE